MQQAVLAMSALCLRLVGIRQVWQMSSMSSSDGCRGKKATSCCRVESNGCPSLMRRAVAAAKFPRTEGAGIGGGWDCPSERAGWAGWAGLGWVVVAGADRLQATSGPVEWRWRRWQLQLQCGHAHTINLSKAPAAGNLEYAGKQVPRGSRERRSLPAILGRWPLRGAGEGG
ncbi:hypothetical protein GQ607_005326 [Colletotrichum asianum]|uniref:Uncharacterized protein n=1 Tax=Colletotrichum asianum TaxID=702518 RepID=A0A8H3WJL1_9PEZI|nr:hypothetical protein GQ607_005326 [Colletotrichum asianum]